jgi:hypothetical protein
MSKTTPAAPVMMPPGELTRCIDRLTEILTYENSMMSLRNPGALMENHAEKSRLVALYNQQMSVIKANRDVYAQYPEAEIDWLKERSLVFYDALDAHFRKLSNVKAVTEGLVKAVADEVAKKNAPPKTYTAAAGYSSESIPSQNTRTVRRAISLNQVV